MARSKKQISDSEGEIGLVPKGQSHHIGTDDGGHVVLGALENITKISKGGDLSMPNQVTQSMTTHTPEVPTEEETKPV